MADQNQNPRKQPKGPQKPWDPEMEEAGEQFVSFLKDPANKRKLEEFVIHTFKQMESDRVDEIKARVENERRVDNSHRMTEFHKPGNIAPLMSEDLNMTNTERAYVRALQSTQKNLERTVEDRVEEINRLLSGIGGMNSQLKSCFARSTVVFLEQDDPKHSFRERLTFSIHLPKYELKSDWGREEGESFASGAPHKKGSQKGSQKSVSKDGRTAIQMTWDNAVNALAAIIETAGLKPKYCKNDRNYGQFVMKQDLRNHYRLPDEYFSLTLDYNTDEKIEELKTSYNKIISNYNKKLAALEKKLRGYHPESQSQSLLKLRQTHMDMLSERDFFVASVPDPNQLDEGLVFLIEVSSLKDYHIVKDKMQSIMTKFILHLSTIAAKDAAKNPDLAYDLWKSAQNSGDAAGSAGEQSTPKEDVDSLREYLVDEDALEPKIDKPIDDKKKAA